MSRQVTDRRLLLYYSIFILSAFLSHFLYFCFSVCCVYVFLSLTSSYVFFTLYFQFLQESQTDVACYTTPSLSCPELSICLTFLSVLSYQSVCLYIMNNLVLFLSFQFLRKSQMDVACYTNPSSFCLSFYLSFYLSVCFVFLSFCLLDLFIYHVLDNCFFFG